MGTTRNPTITKSGSGTKARSGRKPVSKAAVAAKTETGRVNNAMKNIKET
jgi:hypothetical protein